MSQLAKEAAKSWSSTLRLPKSTFPARPGPADLTNYLRRCTDDLYAWQSRERPASKPFTLHDGPPYANGSLHVGHALNKILKDIICRTKLAEGRRVNYIPGWDCHGLPIEIKALEHYGWERGQKDDPVAIRRVARQFAQETVENQMRGFRSWGIMADWSHHWKTMDEDFELRQLSVFRTMAQRGLIYRQRKPVYWSPSSRTALAEAELEYKDDHISTAALVKFPVIPPPGYGTSHITHVVTWTTTPWTLPANQAVAFNENLQYSRVLSAKHGVLLVAKARRSYLEGMLEEDLRIIDDEVALDELRLSTYKGPTIFEKDSLPRPFSHADFVSSETGTGFVHCAPGHGLEDYEALQPLIRSGRISINAPVDDYGCFTREATPGNLDLLTGKDVFSDGNLSVLKALEVEGLLLAKHRYQHKYPYDWRTKKPIIIRATAQWFADISTIKADTLRALEDVDFRPQTSLARLKSFVENRSEWCISRQRAWGVPIPALYHKETGEALLSDESICHIIDVIRSRGIDAWWSDPPEDSSWLLPGVSASDYVRCTDTMDVWFDSGTSWTAMMSNEILQDGPLADMYIEGTDQHRGWFQSSLLTNVAYQKSVNPSNTASAPFRSLITHGFTLDAEGKKMSKSIGNVVSPNEILSGRIASVQPTSVVKAAKKSRHQILPLGPDALRLWAASSDWTKDVIVSDTIIKAVHSSLHKYRVTFKILLGALQDFNPEDSVEISRTSKTEQIALHHLYQVTGTVRSAFENLEFYKAITAINRWVNAEFSGFYMEAIKDILYCDSAGSVRRRGVQTVLYHIFCQMQAMLGPLTPLLVEETWEHCSEAIRGRSGYPLHRVWEQPPAEWLNPVLEQTGLPLIMAVNSAVKKAQERARSDKKMGSSLESNVLLCLEPEWPSVESTPADALQDILVVSRVEFLPWTSVGSQLRQAFETVTFTNSDKTTATRPELTDIVSEITGELNEWSYGEDVVMSNGTKIGIVIVMQPRDLKCARCWRYVVERPGSETSPPSEADVESNNEPETVHRRDQLCRRCEAVVGEVGSDS